jgi:tRNA-splicing ligase RtcB
MVYEGSAKQLDQFRWELPKVEGMRVPVRVFATKDLFNQMQRDRTFWQATNVAKLPGIVDRAIVMPDGHEGYGFPIGGVAAFNLDEGVISPGGVGYDINCGVRMLSTNIPVEEVRGRMKDLVNTIFGNVPSGVGSKGKLTVNQSELRSVMIGGCKWAVKNGYGVKADLENCEEGGSMEGANPDNISPSAMKRGSPQLGTLGAGNHFLELQEIKEIYDPEIAQVFGLEKGKVSVMIHCGSRGFGHQVCSDYIHQMLDAANKYKIDLPDRELACAPLGSDEAEKYYSAMVCAVNYAFTNRHIIAHWVRESFAKVFGKSWEELGMNLVYDVCHNVAKFEEHGGRKFCVHRKGATRAFGPGRKELPGIYQKTGQPVIVAGTMGTSSYILAGTEKGMQEVWGSSCHGAGRVMSRSAAIRKFWGGKIKEELEKKGEEVKAANIKVLAEEAPGAYKNVDNVIETMHGAGLTKKVAKVIPLGVVKG